MRILFVNGVCAAGGVESCMALLGKGLIARGHHVDAYFHEPGDESHAPGYSLYAGVCECKVGPRPTLSDVIRCNAYDVIHTNLHTLALGFKESVEDSGFRGGVVATCHGNVLPGWPVDRPGWQLAAVSRYVAMDIREVLGIEVPVVHNAFDQNVFRPEGPAVTSSSPVLLWVGRSHDPDKDFAGFAALAGALNGNDWSVWIVDGCTDARRQTIAGWLSGECRVLGALSPEELAEVYRGTAASGGCLVSTSQREALGIAVIEAMACGCPVVVPSVGGLPEIVNDGVTGLIYDRVCGIASVRQKLSELREPGFREELVDSAHAHVAKTFSPERMVSAYELLYLETADGARSTAKKRPAAIFKRARSLAGRLSRL